MVLQFYNIIYKCKFIFVYKQEKNDFNYEIYIFFVQFYVNIVVIIFFVLYLFEKVVYFISGN